MSPWLVVRLGADDFQTILDSVGLGISVHLDACTRVPNSSLSCRSLTGHNDSCSTLQSISKASLFISSTAMTLLLSAPLTEQGCSDSPVDLRKRRFGSAPCIGNGGVVHIPDVSVRSSPSLPSVSSFPWAGQISGWLVKAGKASKLSLVVWDHSGSAANVCIHYSPHLQHYRPDFFCFSN